MPAGLDWIPNPGPQTEVLQRSEFEILYGGARGGGKTDAGLAWMVEPEYIQNPRYSGLVVRRNSDDLSDWISRARHFYTRLRAVFSGNPPVIKFPSGAFIRTGHLKDSNAYTKYQGHEYQKILVEELTQIPRELDYEMLISSARSTIRGLPAQVFCTTNPGGPGHVWVKRRWVDVARLKTFVTDDEVTRIFIPAKVEDNPMLMEIDPMYVKRIESITDEKLRRAWRDGDWDTFSGQFFDRWNPHVHVIKPFRIPSGWALYRGFDWGYRDPSACVWVAVDYDGNHYVYREYQQAGRNPSGVARDIIALTGGEFIINTRADTQIWTTSQYRDGGTKQNDTVEAIADIFDREGFVCSPANKSRVVGWMKVRELMHYDFEVEPVEQPKLKVFDTCHALTEAIPGLVHDDNNVEDVNTRGDDHLADALRYIVMFTTENAKPTPPKSEYEKLIDKLTNDFTHEDELDREWDFY